MSSPLVFVSFYDEQQKSSDPALFRFQTDVYPSYHNGDVVSVKSRNEDSGKEESFVGVVISVMHELDEYHFDSRADQACLQSIRVLIQLRK